MRRSFELLSTPGAQAGPGEIGRPYARAGGRERIALPELSALAFLYVKKVSSGCIVLFRISLAAKVCVLGLENSCGEEAKVSHIPTATATTATMI